MCGHEGLINEAIVEGSLLSVCEKCSTFGKVVQLEKPTAKAVFSKLRKHPTEELKEIVVENCATLIKEAREKRNMKQEELAAHLQEKTSILQRLETGTLVPSLTLARKIEKQLTIKLVEPYLEKKQTTHVNLHNKKLTIGDLIKVKKDK
tara:strand:+ start:3083 stop:3529 length:447 start_codon:yes stop_codon:yes gene_type:complete